MNTIEKPARATVLTQTDARLLLRVRNLLTLGRADEAGYLLEAFADPAMTKINSWGWIEAIAGGTAADFAPAVKTSASVDTLGDFTEPSELDIEHQLQATSVPVELARAMEGPRASPSQQEVAAPVTEADMLKVIDERDSYHEVADDLASQIAAITGQELGEHSSGNDPWRNAMLAADEFIAQQLRDMVVAASRSPAAVVAAFGDEMVEAAASALVDSCIAKGHWRHATEESKAVYREHASAVLASAASQRVLVASPAEPIKVTDAMVETYLTANDDYWARTDQMPDKNPSKWRQGTPKEATRESLSAVFALLATPPAGGAGVMDARPDSFHLDSGECGRVQGVELSGDELALFQRTLDGFADCGETETDYETLVNWARRGLLECTNFQPTAAAHRMLATSTSTEQKGGAA